MGANREYKLLNMLTTEFKMEDAIAVWREEGREEGREEERYNILTLIDSGYSIEEIKAKLRGEKDAQ